MYEKQFSYSCNSSELCGLLIYSAFQQYITKNMGLCGTGSCSGFKFIRTMKSVKEEENMFIPSNIPISTSQIPVVTRVCYCFIYTLREASEEGWAVHFIQFILRSGCSESPASWQWYQMIKRILIFHPHPLDTGAMRSDYFWWWWQSRIKRIKQSSSQRFGFFPICTFCSLMSPPSILDISQEIIGSWCSHLGVQKIDVL